MGMVSDIITTFSRKHLFGYKPMVLAIAGIAGLGFIVWGHHMFQSGMDPRLGTGFMIATIMIALPSAVKTFNWLATVWEANVHYTTAMLNALAFVALFVIGGLSGIFMAATPVDVYIHDTYFIVAHLHYVLFMSSIFGIFGGIYYWFPKITGRMLSERLGRWNFWLLFVGFNVTFFPMHQLGLNGMPRRVYTYLPETGWGTLNLIATIGAVTMGIAVVVFLVNAASSMRSGALAGDDPWGGETLEWDTTSPPPDYNWAHLPTVRGRSALWDEPAARATVTGLRTHVRDILVTTTVDAEPDHLHDLPGSSIWPLMLALAATIGIDVALFTPWGVTLGAVLTFFALLGWFVPKDIRGVPR